MLIGKREDFDLNEMAIFAHVVEAGSFTGAAKHLGLPKSTISRKITQLEERLGVRLIQRTTRSLSLTDTGSAYYNQCSRILAEIKEANLAVTQMQSTPSGVLRISAPMLFGSTVLATLIAEFVALHPQVDIDLVLSDQQLDLIQDAIDISFRVGQLEDSSLIGRYLGDVGAILCVSPEYLKNKAAPTHPQELLENYTLMTLPQWNQWQMTGPNDEEINLTVNKPRILANDFATLYTLALAGAGIVPLPTMIAAPAIRHGKLIPLLEDWPFESAPVHALYPSNRHLSAKVRIFIDFIIENVRANPPWAISQPIKKQ